MPAIYIASNVIAGSLRLVTSRILDLWGRPQGFVIMVAVAVLGLILMATTTNVATFAAAQVFMPLISYSLVVKKIQVFYSLGLDGLIYTVDVVTADASSLKNRALAYAFTSSPYIITAFAGPKAAEGFYENNWRWGFGAFCIILPFVAAPLFGILIHNQHKAKKAGLLPSRNSGRTVAQSIWFYIIEFDGKPQSVCVLSNRLTCHSAWCFLVRYRLLSFPSSVLVGRQRSKRMANRLHHCNDRSWRTLDYHICTC